MPPDKRWHDWHFMVWEFGIRKLVESCGAQSARMMTKKEVGDSLESGTGRARRKRQFLRDTVRGRL